MEAQAAIEGLAPDDPARADGPAAEPATRRSRLTTLAVMGVTAVIIVAVAVFVNQPPASADGLTAVTLSGEATGAAPEVGQPAPDFAATTVDGTPVRLSDFQGQPVWLTFGASWCQPCRAENPDIKATAEKYAADGLVVLAVFISEDEATVRDYATRVGLAYPKVADPGTRLASQYRILGIPSHYFIDRDGNLQAMKIGSLDIPGMESAIEGIR
jgi:peroxiredoxin